jgi:hypothetical protein
LLRLPLPLQLCKCKYLELPVVLLEDTTGEFGLVISLVGVSASAITGNPVWDAIGTLTVGILLMLVAVILGAEVVGSVIHLKTLFWVQTSSCWRPRLR